MNKVFYSLLTILILAALLIFSGCSSDNSTGPDDSTDIVLSNKLASTVMKNVLIGFSGEQPDAILKSIGAETKRTYKHIPVVYASVPENAIKGLRNNPNILFVEDEKYRVFYAQVLDWGVDRIDAEYVHATSGNRGAGINVAVLDTGGDMDHPDLTWAGGISMVDSDPNNWEDKNGHGTHCSGIISANDNTIGVVGVAPECDIYMVQVAKTSLISVSAIIAGIDWCVNTHYDSDPNNDIQIMSMSFGGPGSDGEYTALETAFDAGILLVAAAGNESGAVSAPGNYPFVMAISASTSTDAFASYSNFGTEIELIAPGSYIYSTYKKASYRSLSGTSMACPMVAGGAAMAWAAHPTYTRDQIRDLLHNTAEDIGLSSLQQGYGLLDVENAALGTTNGDDY